MEVPMEQGNPSVQPEGKKEGEKPLDEMMQTPQLDRPPASEDSRNVQCQSYIAASTSQKVPGPSPKKPPDREPNWGTWVEWLMEVAFGNSFQATVIKLAFSTTVYCIWKDRNKCKFQGSSRGISEIAKDIGEMIRDSLSNRRRVPRTPQNLSAASSWGLPDVCFGP
ncbi:hypothetical protein U1Q18_031852 [Sarracenia purpurea var. burkii]